MIDAVGDAGVFHDLGKLDERNQAVLASPAKSKKGLPIDHIDAGVLHLWNQGSIWAAILVSAHHSPGLPDLNEIKSADDRLLALREWRLKLNGNAPEDRQSVFEGTQKLLNRFVSTHDAECAARSISKSAKFDISQMRIALSCLVDADHQDAAHHDSGVIPTKPPPTRWLEREAKLRAYLDGKASDKSVDSARLALRRDFFNECSKATIEPIYSCEGTVGVGKTTAVMGHLLAVAAKKNLRRLFVVAPYTAIINQTVERLREALVLDGEVDDEIVAAHHSQMDFESIESRDLAQLWRAPIVVTTAVQFFETLAASRPGKLRKLHELPGSGIFIDESHACLPSHLWPLAWKWLTDATNDCGCHVVMASGTMVRFWEEPELIGKSGQVSLQTLPSLASDSTRAGKLIEAHRVQIEPHLDPISADELIDRIRSAPGPRLVIVNTTQSAAALAQKMRDEGDDVDHLSTLLCPLDRELAVRRINQRLSSAGKQSSTNWTLVSTSCVEAGVDFSFQSGFREAWSVASLLQTSGRINRGNEYDDASLVSFDLIHHGLFNKHPGADLSASVLRELFMEGCFENAFDPSEVASEAFRRELFRSATVTTELIDAELNGRFPLVAEKFRIIEDSGYLVVVRESLIGKIRSFERPTQIELSRGSIAMPVHMIDKLGLEPASGMPGVFLLSAGYDRYFLGAGRAVLDTAKSTSQNFLSA
ncbi:MAG: CRISPR-associated protein [bacterium]|nr:CRISPR-associated protein [bacterium]